MYILLLTTDCGAPNSINNGSIVIDEGMLYNATVTYSCDTGYYLSNNVSRVCDDNGVWSGEDPTCLIYG